MRNKLPNMLAALGVAVPPISFSSENDKIDGLPFPMGLADRLTFCIGGGIEDHPISSGLISLLFLSLDIFLMLLLKPLLQSKVFVSVFSNQHKSLCTEFPT